MNTGNDLRDARCIRITISMNKCYGRRARSFILVTAFYDWALWQTVWRRSM